MVHDGVHKSWKQYGPSFADTKAVGELDKTRSRVDPSKLQAAGAAASSSGQKAAIKQVQVALLYLKHIIASSPAAKAYSSLTAIVKSEPWTHLHAVGMCAVSLLLASYVLAHSGRGSQPPAGLLGVLKNAEDLVLPSVNSRSSIVLSYQQRS